MSLPDVFITEFTKELSLNGCGFSVLNDQIFITADNITNNRNQCGCSGSLSLELWALESPYLGEGFNGQLVAYTHLTPLLDGYEQTNNSYQLPFNEPTAGTWYMTLMLREWNGSNYISKDHVNFPVPYIVSQAVVISEVDNVISVDFTGQGERSAHIGTVTDTTIITETNVTAKQANEQLDDAVSDDKAALELPKAKDTLITSDTTKTAVKRKRKTKAKAGVKISINKAAIEELEGVKHLPIKIAAAIMDARPHKSFDELLKIKGMGPKLLKKIEGSIKL